MKAERGTPPVWEPLLFLLFSFSAFSNFLLPPYVEFGNDWRYFNTLSLVVRSLVLNYHTLPLHNPWLCGGLDIVSNPQSRVFSPFFLFDLALPPQGANLLSLVTYGWLGAWGMCRLLRELGYSTDVSVLGSFFFVHSSWFGLHFSEGHIPFGSMQLLPWVLYLCLRLGDPRSFFWLCLLLAFVLLDGGVYTFVFATLLIATAFLFGILGLRWKDLRALYANPRATVWTLVAFALLASAKVMPAVSGLQGRPPQWEEIRMPGTFVLRVLFSPIQALRQQMPAGVRYEFHEYGCYLGIIGVGIVVIAFGERSFRKKNVRVLLWVCFWLWIATGAALLGWNPWFLFRNIPLINVAHVQSRFLVFVLIGFVLLLASALQEVQRRRMTLFVTLVMLLFVESFAVRHLLTGPPPRSDERNVGWDDLIRSTRIERTVARIPIPWGLLEYRNEAAADCYEPAVTDRPVLSVSDPNYRGEVFVESGPGRASVSRFLPGLIELNWEGVTPPTRITINTRGPLGWRVAQGIGRIVQSESGVLRIVVPTSDGGAILKYRPTHVEGAAITFGVGIFCAFVGHLLSRRKATGARFNYDAIPAGYYHSVMESGNPIRRAWHLHKFERILDCLPEGKGLAILDVGCFAGTFLSLVPTDRFSTQVGVDILEKQIAFAQEKFGSVNRRFVWVPDVSGIAETPGTFDCITLIEVIEHLDAGEIEKLLDAVVTRLKPGGRFILSTPNYASVWPVLEWILNRASDVKYEEQHITKFQYFGAVSKLRRIYPRLDSKLVLEFKTTTHFVTPFLAGISMDWAHRLSRRVPHHRWHLPFGSLLLMGFRRV